MTPRNVLENCLIDVIENPDQEYPELINQNIKVLFKYLDVHRNIIFALATSLLKKIISPEQDIRYHQNYFIDGYAARTLDTKISTPFFNEYFPNHSNRSSAFLAESMKKQIPWTLEDGGELNIKIPDLKYTFLSILNDVQKSIVPPEKYLSCLMNQLVNIVKKDGQVVMKPTVTINPDTRHTSSYNTSNRRERTVKKPQYKIVNPESIIAMLQKHFEETKNPELPRIAFYTMYQILTESLTKYSDKMLIPLSIHFSSDYKALGDIEIITKDAMPYEMVDVVGNNLVEFAKIIEVKRKSENMDIPRFSIITTNPQIYRSQGEARQIATHIKKIKAETNLEIIVDNLFNCLTYYLRVLDNYLLYIEYYGKNILEVSKISKELDSEVITSWGNILTELS